MTSSVIFSTKISNSSTIETSGQPLTSSEIISNKITSISTIGTSGKSLTISKIMYITKVNGTLSSYEVILIHCHRLLLSLQP